MLSSLLHYFGYEAFDISSSFLITHNALVCLPRRGLRCEPGLPTGGLSDLLRLQWLPLLQATPLHAPGEDGDEADRRVHDVLPAGLLRHALARQEHVHE